MTGTLSVAKDFVLEIPALSSRADAFLTASVDPSSPFHQRDLLPVRMRDGETPAMRFQGYTLDHDMTIDEIVEAAGGEEVVREKHIFTPSQIRHAVDQWNYVLNDSWDGVTGHFLLNIKHVLFLVLTEDDPLALAVVCVRLIGVYSGYGWGWGAESDLHECVWRAGCRLFLRA